MKAIPGNSAGPQWKNSLADDLEFIKKNRRYRFSKKTLPTLAFAVLTVAFICRLCWMANIARESGNFATLTLVPAMMIVTLVSIVARVWYTLRFSIVQTPFSARENMKLLNDFLAEQQLNIYRHPGCPEVCQIISRPLGNNELKREVMIFIADDNRLLANSHFVNQKWSISSSSGNARQMTRHLAKWIADRTRSVEIMAR